MASSLTKKANKLEKMGKESSESECQMDSIVEESFKCLKSWGEAVSQGIDNKSAVLDHYEHEEGATLWPTLSNELRTNRDRVGDYFDHFLPKINVGNPPSWDTKNGQVMDDNVVLWSGSYTFQLTNGPAAARYTYLVKKNEDGEWKIHHHHSSLMPE